MKLNVGSGPHPAPSPWINVDRHPELFDNVHVAVSVLDLPFRDRTVEAIYAGHILEHLGWHDELPAALAEFRRVLRFDGVLCVVGPCIDLAIATRQPEDLLAAIREDWAEPSGLGHRWTPTARLTGQALAAAGFVVAEVDVTSIVPPEWPNPSTAPWQCAFVCLLTTERLFARISAKPE